MKTLIIKQDGLRLFFVRVREQINVTFRFKIYQMGKIGVVFWVAFHCSSATGGYRISESSIQLRAAISANWETTSKSYSSSTSLFYLFSPGLEKLGF